jgi:hypothetical protein
METATTFAAAFDLSGRVAILTGAAGGIGAPTAALLAERGARLVLVDRSPAVREQAARLGPGHLAFEAEVNDEAQAAEIVARVVAEAGRLDILVNNAGVATLAPAEATSSAMWDETMAVNLRAPFLWAREAGRAMLAAGRGGRIVNMASQAAVIALDGHLAYCASKAGLARPDQGPGPGVGAPRDHLQRDPAHRRRDRPRPQGLGRRGRRGLQAQGPRPPLRPAGGDRAGGALPRERGGGDGERGEAAGGRGVHDRVSHRLSFVNLLPTGEECSTRCANATDGKGGRHPEIVRRAVKKAVGRYYRLLSSKPRGDWRAPGTSKRAGRAGRRPSVKPTRRGG